MPRFIPCGRTYTHEGATFEAFTPKAICSDGRFCPHCCEILALRAMVSAYRKDMHELRCRVGAQNPLLHGWAPVTKGYFEQDDNITDIEFTKPEDSEDKD